MLIKDMDISYTSYMGLYSWYSWPNVVMSFLGGFLIDNYFGIRLGTIIFGLLTLLGQLMFALSVYVNKLWLMDLSRFIFGIGAESLAVAQNTYAAIWFKDKELNIVFGLQISISRLGSTINSNTMAPLYYHLRSLAIPGQSSLALALLVASTTCVFSLVFCFILGYLDLRAHKNAETPSNTDNSTKMKLKDFLDFKLSLWALCIICFMFYATVLPFVSIAQAFFFHKYRFSITNANLANSLIYIISALVSPFFGLGVDYFGYNLMWLTCGMLMLLIGHALVAFTLSVSPFVMTTLMGLSYSMVASSLWGLVTYIVPREKQGTAYGLMQAIMNLGVGIISISSGKILDTYGYFSVELLFLSCLMIGIFVLILLFIWDGNHSNILNSSQKKRLLMKEIKD